MSLSRRMLLGLAAVLPGMKWLKPKQVHNTTEEQTYCLDSETGELKPTRECVRCFSQASNTYHESVYIKPPSSDPAMLRSADGWRATPIGNGWLLVQGDFLNEQAAKDAMERLYIGVLRPGEDIVPGDVSLVDPSCEASR